MKDIKYTQEELEILEYMQTAPKSVVNASQRISQIKQAAKEHSTKKKQINIRLLESDVEKLKTQALIDGIPYQTLVNSIVHKFLNGTLI